MYHPPPPREPNGCLQTLVISRMIFQILAIPILMILGALTTVIILLYAFTESPFLGLLVIVIAGFLLYGVMQWERRRIERDLPPDD